MDISKIREESECDLEMLANKEGLEKLLEEFRSLKFVHFNSKSILILLIFCCLWGFEGKMLIMIVNNFPF